MEIKSNKAQLLSGKGKIENESDIGLIAANLYLLLSGRIDRYMLEIPDYKYLSVKEWDEKKTHLNNEVNKRFSAFVKRRLVGLSEFAVFMIAEKEYLIAVWESFENNVDELYKIIDDILCSIEPKFKNVVEHKIADVNKEKEDKVEEIEKLFNSLSNAKNITYFYLYVSYFIHLENLDVKSSINKTTNFLTFNHNKDIEDIKNSYNTWKSDNSELVDKVLEFVSSKK